MDDKTTDAEIMRYNHYTRVRYIEISLYDVYRNFKAGKISRERFDRERERWNNLWKAVKPTLPYDTIAPTDQLESVIELCDAIK